MSARLDKKPTSLVMASIMSISLCSQAMTATPQYVRCFGVFALSRQAFTETAWQRPGQIYHLLDLSLCLSPSSYVFTLFSCLFCHFVTNTVKKPNRSYTVYTRTAFDLLEKRALKMTTRLFFQNICYQRSFGMLQSLVRGPAFLAISRMI